jgi:5-methylcytosine-specific restriction endonuclease McrA
MEDEDVTSKKGIYYYLLTGEEKHLSIRTFTDRQKREAYEQQNGICVKCEKEFELSQMHADHIIPWSKGGRTTADNCQMLCAKCNGKKSNK